MFQFTSSALESFSSASQDRNPLHLDRSYASRTPFGSQVVFGIAICLKMLTAWAEKKGSFRLRELKCDFKKPLLLDEGAEIEFIEGEVVKCTVKKASQVLAKVSFSCEPCSTPALPSLFKISSVGSRRFSEHYSMDAEALAQLKEAYSWKQQPIPTDQIAFLLWSSFFVGMEHPGAQALYSSIKCSFPSIAIQEILVGEISKDSRFALHSIQGRLNSKSEFQITALERPLPVDIALSSIHAADDRKFFAGKKALVTGGSRGFGAALVKTLAVSGTDVDFTYLSNVGAARKVQDEIVSIGRDCNIHGINWANSELSMNFLTGEQKKYDMVFLNAMPLIEMRPFNTYERDEFGVKVKKDLEIQVNSLKRAMSLVREGGSILFISSIFVSNPEPGFSTYVAVKSAIEGMLQVAALEFPRIRFHAFRLPRMLTDQTNSPGVTKTMAGADTVALKVLNRLSNPTVAYLETVQ